MNRHVMYLLLLLLSSFIWSTAIGGLQKSVESDKSKAGLQEQIDGLEQIALTTGANLIGSVNHLSNSTDGIRCYDDYPPGRDFMINDDMPYSPADIQYSYIAGNNNGDAIAIWLDDRYPGESWLYAQLYDINGPTIDCNIGLFKYSDYFSFRDKAGRCPVAMDQNGNFVFTWVDSESKNIMAQLYDSDGIPNGDPIIVNDGSPIVAYKPSVAMSLAGHFVIVWEDERNSMYDDIYAQVFNNSGQPIGDNMLVNDDNSISDQWSAVVAMNDNNEFVVAWQDGRNDGLDPDVDRYNDSTEIFMQRYASDGAPIGDNIRVNDEGTSTLWEYPAIDIDNSGNIVITWSDSRDGERKPYWQRFDSENNPLGSNQDLGSLFYVSTPSPAVNMKNDGSFVIAGNSYNSSDNEYDVCLQPFDSDGNTNGGVITATGNVYKFRPQENLALAIGSNEQEFLSWTDGFSHSNVILQRYSSSYEPIGGNILINDDEAHQYRPVAASNESGVIIAAWLDERAISSPWSGHHLFIQRLVDGYADGPNQIVGDPVKSIYEPDVAVGPSGNGIVIWKQHDYPTDRLYACYVDNGGNVEDTYVRIDDNEDEVTVSYPWDPKVAASGDYFMVAWTDRRNDNYDVYAQVLDNNAERVGGNFMVHEITDESTQVIGCITGLSNGSFLIAWGDNRPTNYGIYVRQFDETGTPLTDELNVMENPSAPNSVPNVAVLESGDAMVCWYENRDNIWGIYAQRISSSGELIGGNFKVNSDSKVYPRSTLDPPQIAVRGDKDMVIAWTYYNSESGEYKIYARAFDPETNAYGEDFLLTDMIFENRRQISPTLTASDDGYFAAWQDDRRDKGWDNFARYFETLPTDEIYIDAKVIIRPVAWQPHDKVKQNSGKINCWIGNLSDGYHVSEINIESVRLNETVSPINGKAKIIMEHDEFDGEVLRVAFSRYEAMTTLESNEPDTYEIEIAGSLEDGTTFSGTAEIKLPGQQRVETNEVSIIKPVLYQNRPNPFNPITEISFGLSSPSEVTLDIYNIAGQRIAVLFDGLLEGGPHSFIWDASNSASGIYLYRLTTEDFIETKKMLLLK